MSGRVVIVGAGQAGLQVASSLRQDGFAGSITLIGEEPGLPYQRPPLSKAYMKDGDAARLALKPDSFFARADIAYRPMTRVAAIDRPAAEVVLDDGERLGFDHLVLATGARTIRPPLDGLDLPGVHELRGLDDARRLRDAMAQAHRAVVIGGGFIGLEFASVARAAGLEVTVLEATDRLMGRSITAAMSARFLAAHVADGVDVRLRARAHAILGTDRVEGVTLDSGVVPADLVLVATGVRPNAELAEAAGLAVANGVVVDADLRTEDPRIFAIGDCANFPSGQERIRLESVQAATDHARHVARAIMGAPAAPYAALPWFWSDQGALKLQIAGLSTGADEIIAQTDEDGAVHSVFAFRGDRLIAVETVNRPGVHIAARKLLGAGVTVTPAALIAAGHDLKALLPSA